MRKFYVWVRPNQTYYAKFIHGYYKYNHVGDINSYNHKLVLIIDNPYIKTNRIYHRKPFKRFIGWIYKNL